ncbi:hypothetical protein D3C80_1469940 [compost metagenome]
MTLQQYAGNRHNINAPLLKRLDDHMSCLCFIPAVNLLLCEEPGTRYSTVEGISMRSSHNRNIKSRLRPDGCPHGVRMHNAADFLVMLIQHSMGRCIRGRSEIALYNVTVKIDNDHIAGFHFLIADSAWFNDEQALLTVNRAHIAPGVLDKSLLRQVQIGLEYLFLQLL